MLFFQIFMGIVLAEMQMFCKDLTGCENLNKIAVIYIAQRA